MRQTSSLLHPLLRPATALAAILLAALPIDRAAAVDLLGLYAGAAVGQSQVEADASGITAGSFKENHSAYKFMAGVRVPVFPIGAEVAYIDFGHPNGSLGGQSADVTVKGEAAFGVFYLPLPLPIVDVYAKAGLARLQSTVSSSFSLAGTVRSFRLDRTDTSFAGGVGTQFKLGSLAVRAEYERFDAGGGNPGLVSLGLTWTFL